MSQVLAFFDVTVVSNVVVFVLTMIFRQKILDFFTGVPAEVRAALKAVEAAAIGNVKVAQAAVLSQLKTALPPVATPAAAPAAPAPASAEAAPAAPAAPHA